jgi:hypothetical protein
MYDIMTGGKDKSDMIEGYPDFKNMTYKEALQLLMPIYIDSKPSNINPLTLHYNSKAGSFRVGDTVFNKGSINEDFKEFLSNYLAGEHVDSRGEKLVFMKNVPRASLNTKMFYGKDFRFLGQDFSNIDTIDFVAQNDILRTRFLPVNGKWFVKPRLDVRPKAVIEESAQSKQETERIANEIPVTNTTVNEDGSEQKTGSSLNNTEAKKSSAPTGTINIPGIGNVNFDDINTKLQRAPRVQDMMSAVYMNPKQAEERIKRILPNVPTRVRKGLMKINAQGDLAEAAFANGMIILTDKMQAGTEYHEAFHAVFALYLDEDQRNDLLQEIKEAIGSPTKQQLNESGARSEAEWLEERLADRFKAFMMSDGKAGFLREKEKSFFAELWDMIVNIFRNKTTVNEVFNNAAKGVYKTKPQSDRITAMANAERYQRAVPGWTDEQSRKVVDGLIHDILSSEDVDLFNNEDLSLIKGKHIMQSELLGYIKAWKNDSVRYKGVLPDAMLEKYNNLYEHAANNVDIIQELLVDKLYSLGVESTIELDTLENTLTEEGSPVFESKSAFEYSRKDNANGNVKLMLTGLLKKDSKGNATFDLDTGRFELEDMGDIFNVLQENLGNLVSTYDATNNKFESAWDKMLAKIEDITPLRRSLDSVLAKLKDANYPESKKQQFFNTFSAAKYNFKTIRSVSDSNSRVKRIDFINSNQYTPQSQIRYQWKDTMATRVIKRNKETGKLEKNYDGVKSLANIFYNTMDIAERNVNVYSASLDLDESAVNEINGEIEALRRALNLAGLTISDGTLEYFIDYDANNEQREGNLAKRFYNAIQEIEPAMQELGELLDVESDIAAWVTGSGKTKSRLDGLAKVESLHRRHSTETSAPGAGNSTYNMYAHFNNFLKKSQELNTNKDLVQRLLNVGYNSSSLFLEKLKESLDEDSNEDHKLIIEVVNNVRGENDAGDAVRDLTDGDDLLARIVSTLKDHYDILTAGDKPVNFKMSGIKIPTNRAVWSEEDGYEFHNESNVNRIAAYFVDELARMRQCWVDLQEPGSVNLIKNFHTGEKNGLKSFLFPTLTPFNADGSINKQKAKELGIDYDGKSIPTWGPDIINKVKPAVRKALNGLIDQDLNDMIEAGIVERMNGKLVNKAIDISTQRLYNQQGENLSSDAIVRRMAADFTIKSLMANVEVTKMFTGDPAYYKNTEELTKRVPGIVAPGQDLDIRNLEEREFGIAVLKDIEKPIKKVYYDQYFDAIVEDYKNRNKDRNITKEELDKRAKQAATDRLKPYEEVNQADAQAYITLDRYEFLLKKLGQWDTNRHPDLFAKLRANQKPSLEEMTYIQPLKGMYFDLDVYSDSTRAIPRYLKYSQAPLIPGLIAGTELEDLAQRMKDSNIDEAVFESGMKSGIQGAVEASGMEALNRISLDNRHWKLQLDMDAKYMKKNQVIEPSQLLKNALANIIDSEDYDGIDGVFLKKEFVNIDNELSNIGLQNFLNEFGISVDEEGDFQGIQPEVGETHSRLYEAIIQDLKSKDAPAPVVRALSEGVPLDSMPAMKAQIQSSILAMLKKRSVSLKMPGASLIQMSPALITAKRQMMDAKGGIQNSDILWTQEDTELKPPRKGYIDEKGKKIEVEAYEELTAEEKAGYKKTMLAGQVLMPFKPFDDYKKKFPGESDAKILARMKAAGIMKGVSARIPNQDLPSSDFIDIVGVLPSYLGDTIISYPEITAKSGSDYDIDKLFVMMYNYDITKDGKVRKVQYMGAETKVEDRYRRMYESKAWSEHSKYITERLKADEDFNEEAKKDLDQYKKMRGDLLKSFKYNKEAMYASMEYEAISEKLNDIRGSFKNNTYNQIIDEALNMLSSTGDIESMQSFEAKSITAQNSKRALQNRKLDLYEKLLSSNQSFSRLISSIDAEWLKKDAYSVAEIVNSGKVKPDMNYFSAHHQRLVKKQFGSGKKGIGIGALQLVDHARTQEAGVYLAKPIGIGPNPGKTSFDRTIDVKGNYITSNLSAYLNAFVDIAKDPYIYHLNINDTTLNTAMFLLRTGEDPQWVNYFMAQPVIADYIKATERQKSGLIPAKYMKTNKGTRRMTAKDIVAEKYDLEGFKAVKGKTIDEAIKDGSGEDWKKHKFEIPPSLETLKDQIKDPKSGFQLGLLDLFMKYSDLAGEFAAQVSAFNADTKGAGKSYMETTVFANRKERALNSKKFVNVSRRDQGTSVANYYDNSVVISEKLMPQLFMEAAPAMVGIVNDVNFDMMAEAITVTDIASSISNANYAQTMLKAEVLKIENTSQYTQLIEMVKGDESMSARLTDLIHGEDSKFSIPGSEIFDSILLRNLKQFEEKIDGSNYRFLRMAIKDPDAKRLIMEDWQKMLNSSDPVISNFAKDLVVYAAHTSSLKSGGSSFFSLVPPNYLVENGLSQHIVNESSRLLDAHSFQEYKTSFKDNYFRNNWNDSKIVPKLNKEERRPLAGHSKDDAFTVSKKSKAVIKLVKEDKISTPIAKKFINVNGKLYKFQGLDHEQYPIYAKTFKKGLQGSRNTIPEWTEGPSQFHPNIGEYKIENVSSINQGLYQRMSEMGRIGFSEARAQLDIVQSNFANRVIWDSNLDEIAKVETRGNETVVVINPDKMREDTVTHEYAHIYIAGLGGMNNPRLIEASNQLRGTDLWKKVEAKYPELSGAKLAEEVLATAIGRAGAQIFRDRAKQSMWDRFTEWIFNQIKKVFGIDQNTARGLAREMLSNQLDKQFRAPTSVDMMLQREGINVEVHNESKKEVKALGRTITELLRRVEWAANVQASKTVNRPNEGDSFKEKRKKTLVGLRALKNNMKEFLKVSESINELKAVMEFVNTGTSRAGLALSKLEEIQGGDQSIDIQLIEEIDTSVEVFKNMKSLRSDILHEKIEGRDIENDKFRDEIIENIDKAVNMMAGIEARIMPMKIKAITKKAMDNNSLNNVYAFARLKYEKEFDRNNKDLKKTAPKREYAEKKREYINEKIAENKDSLDAQQAEFINNRLQFSPNDISMMEMLLLSGADSTDPMIQMLYKQLSMADYKVMRNFQDRARAAVRKFYDVADYKGLLKKPEQIYEGLTKKVTVGNKDNKRDQIVLISKKEAQALPESKKALYDELVSMFDEADQLLPDASRLKMKNGEYRLPAIQKSSTEKLVDGHFIGSIKEAIKDKLKRREDETEFGQAGNEAAFEVDEAKKDEAIDKAAADMIKGVVVDTEGNEVRQVPVYFRNKIEVADQSMDLMGLALSNLFMASNYDEKIRIQYQTEQTRDMIKNRKVNEKTASGIKKVAMGTLKAIAPSYVFKKQESRAGKMVDAFVNQKLYGVSTQDMGQFLGQDIAKTLGAIQGYSSSLMLSLNYPAAFVNYIQGNYNTIFKAAGNQFFGMKNLKTGVQEYLKESVALAKDGGRLQHVKESKLNLILQNFDVMGEFDGLKNDMMRNEKVKAALNLDNLNIFNAAAEHGIQSVLTISLMDNIKALDKDGDYIDKDGNKVSEGDAMTMWEAYEAKDGKLILNEHVATNTFNRGAKEWSRDVQEFEMSYYLKAINIKLNGNYDPKRKTMAQQNAIGAMMMSMRQWLPTTTKERYLGINLLNGRTLSDLTDEELAESPFYNEATKSVEVGRYAALWGLISKGFKRGSMKKMYLDSFRAWKDIYDNDLYDVERSAIASSATGFGTTVAMYTLAAAAAAVAGDDDDDDFMSSAKWFAALMAQRSFNELTFYINPNEWLRTADSPFVALKSLSKVFGVAPALFFPFEEDKEGNNKLFKSATRAVVPLKIWDRFTDPDFKKSYYFQKEGGPLG